MPIAGFCVVGNPEAINLFFESVPTNALVLTGLSNFLVVGYAKAVTDFCSSGFLN